MPCLRRICATGMPASPSFKIATICDSLNLDFFIGLPSSVKSCQKSPVIAVYYLGELTLRSRPQRAATMPEGRQRSLIEQRSHREQMREERRKHEHEQGKEKSGRSMKKS